ncbi:hypothetical protein [Pseudomonas sp. MH10]|uniref:hypothetical protein n=2 Tax=unclassified Pseudomonas TaxID=196821 RepID=UPI002AC90B52|nr:hypothetical protein [Pseudomonas sp. MH10]WPX65075.1 hypothetical protein RHM59_05200 [Pseudomonas sp. MH10]
MSYYAKRIIDDVELGRKTPTQGIDAILKEYRSLASQSQALARDRQRAVSNSVKRIPVPRLTQPAMRPDPERLLRYVFAQHLKVTNEKTLATLHLPVPTSIYERYQLFPPELQPEPIELHDPGFYIVPRSTTVERLEAQLFTSASSRVIAKFRILNPGLDQIKAGQMIVLSDPDNGRCTEEEARLMATARVVNKVLEDLSPEEADFMVLHRDEIESFIKYGSIGTSMAAAVYKDNIDTVGQILKAIEDLHKRTFNQHGHLRSPEFFAERKQLFAQLDTHLTTLTKHTIDYPDHPKLKTALGISSRSLVHRWGRAGAHDMNPGYATHLAALSKASKYINYGGWVGTAISGGASYMKVQDVCRAGDVEACEKVKYTETGGFAGGVAGGIAAGALLGSAGAGAICAALWVPTVGVGTLVCGLVVAGGVSFASGYGGGMAGEAIGEVIYEVSK